MDKQFWINVKENNFAVPENYAIHALTEELITYIGSTDPELRDTIGLEAFYKWLKQERYSVEDLRGIITRLLKNLTFKIGETEDDSVFLRSFSALWLANIVAHDNEMQAFKREEIRKILEAALAYFASERDQRGYIPTKGWGHATAHASDLLSALVISNHTDAADHLKILKWIANKLADSTLGIFRYNEDSRMAQPALQIFIRETLKPDQIRTWVTALTRDWKGAWQNEARTGAYNNGRNFLRALYWYTAQRTENELSNKETVLKILQAGIERAKPWEW